MNCLMEKEQLNSQVADL